VGYVTSLFIGADFKHGVIRVRNWHSSHGNNLTNVSHAKPLSSTPPGIELEDIGGDSLNMSDAIFDHAPAFYGSKQKYFDIFFFTSLQNHLMLYNASLHGQFKKTNYRLDYSETGFLVNNLRFGGAIETQGFGFNLYWAFKSPEMWNSYSRVHSWGGFTFNFKW